MTVSARGLPARIGVLLGLLALGLYAATERLVLPWAVVGDSMLPTLEQADRVLVDLWTYRQRAPRTGEIVLFDGPTPGGSTLIKRVAASPPGQSPTPHPEAWPAPGPRAARETVWVRGDNETQSVDSRHFGPVPRGRIHGRVFYRYWPLSRAGPIR